MRKVIIVFGTMFDSEKEYLKRISAEIEPGRKSVLYLEDCYCLDVEKKVESCIDQIKLQHDLTPFIIYQGSNLSSVWLNFKESINISFLKNYIEKAIMDDYPEKDKVVFTMIIGSIKELLSK